MSLTETIVGVCVMIFFMGGTAGVLSVAIVMLLKTMLSRVIYLENEQAKRQNEKV